MNVATKMEKEQNKGPHKNNQEGNDNPKEKASCLSLVFFWWVGQILRKGNKRSLNDDDLFSLLDEDKSKGLVEKLEYEWKQEQARCQTNGTRPRLWRSVLRMIPMKDYIFVAVLKLIQSSTTVMLPVMLWFFLGSLTNSLTLNHNSAFLWVMGLCFMALVSALSGAHWTYTSDMWGIRLKTATIGLVYKQVSTIHVRLGVLCRWHFRIAQAINSNAKGR